MKQEIIYNVAGGLSVGVLYALTYFGVNRQVKKMKSKVDVALAQYHNSRIAMEGMSPEQRYINEDMGMLVSQKHCHSEGVELKTVVPLPLSKIDAEGIKSKLSPGTGTGIGEIISELSNRIDLLEKDNKNLTVERDSYKSKFKRSTENQRTFYYKTLATTETLTKERDEALKESDLRSKQYSTLHDQFQGTVKILTKERDEALGRARLNYSQYEKHKKDSQKAIELLVTERDRSRFLANQYHDQIKKFQENGKEISDFTKELEEKVAVLEKELKDEKENNARLKHYIKEKDEQIDNLTLRVVTDTFQGTGSSTKEQLLLMDLNACKARLLLEEKVNKDLEEYIEELKEGKEQDLKEIDRLDKRLSNATKERKKLEKKISNQKVQLRFFNEERSQQVVELESIVSSLNNKLVTATFDKNFSKVSNDITLREIKDLKRTLGEVVNLAKSLLLALGSAPLLSRTDANTLKEVEKHLKEVEQKIK